MPQLVRASLRMQVWCFGQIVLCYASHGVIGRVYIKLAECSIALEMESPYAWHKNKYLVGMASPKYNLWDIQIQLSGNRAEQVHLHVVIQMAACKYSHVYM